MSCCLLDEDNFRLCCRLLLQQSDELRDGWSWEQVQGSEEGYLRKTTLRSTFITAGTKWDQEGTESDGEPPTSCDCGADQDKQQCALADYIGGDDDEDESVCVVPAGSSQVLQYEYHILFSCSYSTPVLYFRAGTLEGKSLSLEEVWSSVHPNFRLRLQHSPLNTITQQEHPLLGQPFFMLHPCRTEDFMRPVLEAAQDQRRPVNYVLTWLSVVAPLVGLEVPLQYSIQLHPGASGSSSEPD